MGEKRQEIAEKEKERQEEKEQKKHHEEAEEKKVSPEELEKTKQDGRWGNGHARIQSVKLYAENGQEQNVFATGSLVMVKVAYELKETVKDAVFGIGVFRSDGVQCYGTNTRIDQLEEFNLTKSGTMCLSLDHVNLLPGEYWLDIAIESEVGIPVDYYRQAAKVEFYSQIGDVGIAGIDHKWKLPE